MAETIVVGVIVCLAAALLLRQLVRFLRGARSRSEEAGCPTCPGCAGATDPMDGDSRREVECPAGREMDSLRRGTKNSNVWVPLILGLSLWGRHAGAVDPVEPFDTQVGDAELTFDPLRLGPARPASRAGSGSCILADSSASSPGDSPRPDRNGPPEPAR